MPSEQLFCNALIASFVATEHRAAGVGAGLSVLTAASERSYVGHLPLMRSMRSVLTIAAETLPLPCVTVRERTPTNAESPVIELHTYTKA